MGRSGDGSRRSTGDRVASVGANALLLPTIPLLPSLARGWLTHAKGTAMDDVARVILAIGSQEVAEEVLHLLDRSGRARVVATAADDRQLAEAVRQLEPDAVVAEPAIAAAGVGSAALLALATRESIAALRAAIGAGAQGFYVWPQERQALLGRVLALAAAPRVPERRATVG